MNRAVLFLGVAVAALTTLTTTCSGQLTGSNGPGGSGDPSFLFDGFWVQLFGCEEFPLVGPTLDDLDLVDDNCINADDINFLAVKIIEYRHLMLPANEIPLYDFQEDGILDQCDLFYWLHYATGEFGHCHGAGEGGEEPPPIFEHIDLPPADVDFNSITDGRDFIEWNFWKDQSTLFTTDPYSRCDFNADGRTDGRDLAIWELAFQLTAQRYAAGLLD